MWGRAQVFGEESVALHVVASLVTGFVATTVAAPFDIIKTRYMADGGSRYTGAIHCVKELVRHEGVAALFKGTKPGASTLSLHSPSGFAPGPRSHEPCLFVLHMCPECASLPFTPSSRRLISEPCCPFHQVGGQHTLGWAHMR